MSDIVEARERQERAEEAKEARDGFASRVSILVAVLAVVTAATGSLENTETAAAITSTARAVLAQDQATDQWGFFEAKSLKKNLFEVAAASGGPRGVEFGRRAAREGSDQAGAEARARTFERRRDEALEAGERHEARHHRLSLAATLLEIGIAISTIAIITRKHWPWVLSALLGAGGVGLALSAFL